MRHEHRARSFFLIAAALLVVDACVRQGGVPPAELAAARTAVAQAQASPLSLLAPAELRAAEQALSIAEREARLGPGVGMARDAAYVARRRAQCSQLASLVASDRKKLEGARRAAAALRARAPRARGMEPPSAAPGRQLDEQAGPRANDPPAHGAVLRRDFQ